jgi:hypothetical protein
MGKALIDLTGQRFHDVTVKEISGRNKHGGILWKCVCDCGSEVVLNGDSLKSGNTKSCGCRKAHKNSETTKADTLYKSWRGMMRRCYEKSHHAYNRYGGRGISVCDSWHDYLAFSGDMGARPEGMTLDRIDNDGGYSPENCKWSSKSEQAKNRSKRETRAKRYECSGESLTIYQWAEKTGVPHYTLRMRIKRGIPIELAVQNIDLRGAYAGK